MRSGFLSNSMVKLQLVNIKHHFQGLHWMPETSFVATEVDALLIIAKSSLLVSSLLASLACASSFSACNSSRVGWGPLQMFSCFAASLFTFQRFATTFSALKSAGIAWSAPIQMLLPSPTSFCNVVAFAAFPLHHICYCTYIQVATSYVHLPTQ